MPSRYPLRIVPEQANDTDTLRNKTVSSGNTKVPETCELVGYDDGRLRMYP